MNAYAAVAAVLGFLAAAHIRATATVGGAHLSIPLLWLLAAGVLLILAAAHTRATATVGAAHLSVPVLWLLAAAVVLALAVVVLALWRAIMQDGGFWLTVAPAGAT